jgi:hypothetical protein
MFQASTASDVETDALAKIPVAAKATISHTLKSNPPASRCLSIRGASLELSSATVPQRYFIRYGGRHMQRIFQAAAWLLAATIVVLSLGPPSVRPVTGAAHDLEHLLIFLATGVAFGFAIPIDLAF